MLLVLLSFLQRNFSQTLHCLTTTTLRNDNCREKLHDSQHGLLLNTTVCATTAEGQGVCSGDTGAGLVTDDKLVGFLSWAISCSKRGELDGYTRLEPYIRWIGEVTDIIVDARNKFHIPRIE